MFNINNFNNLIEISDASSPLISIYIPTYRSGKNQEDQLRFKNALTDAITQLTDENMFGEQAMNKQEASKYLRKCFELLDDDVFWLELSDGLAVFVGPETFEYFIVPINFHPYVYVDNCFHVRHMIPALSNDEKFFVLALSQNEVRFFEAKRNSITPVKINDLVPNGMEAYFDYTNSEKVLQAHSGGTSKSIYHGHGGGKDENKEDLRKYFRAIDEGLMKMLHDEKAPMLIYSVDYQIPIYREVSKYSNISDVGINGNPENDDPVLIHEKAWAEMQTFFQNKRTEINESFNQALANEQASFSIDHVVPASINGKVNDLFVDAKTKEVWGTFDKSTNSITIHKKRQVDSVGLLNKSSVATFNQGGKVHNIPRIEFPKIVAQVNAIYRY